MHMNWSEEATAKVAVVVKVNLHLNQAKVHLGIHVINEERITTKAEVEGNPSNTEEMEEKFGEDVNLPNTVGVRYPWLMEPLSRRSIWTNAY